MRLILAIYGIEVEIQSSSPATEPVLENLARDFEYFRATEPSFPESSFDEPRIRMELSGQAFDPQSQKTGPRVFKTRMCKVYGWGATRSCDYGQGVWVRAQNSSSSRSFVVYGTQQDLVYEAAYVALLSAIGEALDTRGYHRLHAVGVQIGGVSAAFAAQSGQGKSALALLLSQDRSVQLFSDEMPLIHQGKILPFPIRMALRPEVAQALGFDPSVARAFKRKIYPTKALFEISRESVAQATTLDRLFLAESGSRPFFRPSSWIEKTRFLFTFVLGLGLPQMAEHMLRAGNLWGLATIAFSRLRAGIGLLGLGSSKTRVSTFRVSSDPRLNAIAWTEKLSQREHSVSETRLQAGS
jgi:hypothetical protein